MTFVCTYVALHVHDLRAAESFYRDVFAMELLFRESEAEDGTWHTLRPDVDWEEANARGIRVDMLAVRRDGFVLALFPGTPSPGTVHEICIGVALDDLAEIRARVERAATVLEASPRWFRFQDPFGFRWSVQPDDASFRSSGELAERWIP